MLMLLLAVALGAAPHAVAAEPGPPQTLSGIVTDTAGRPLSLVRITVLEAHRSTTTGPEGHYSLSGLPAGTYGVSFALVGFSYLNLSSELRSSVQAQAQLVAMNSSAPLAFEDAVSGRQAVSAMGATPHVGAATVFDLQGRAFARFERETDPAPSLPLGDLGFGRDGRWRMFTLPVDESGQRLGFVQVAYDLDLLYRRLMVGDVTPPCGDNGVE